VRGMPRAFAAADAATVCALRRADGVAGCALQRMCGPSARVRTGAGCRGLRRRRPQGCSRLEGARSPRARRRGRGRRRREVAARRRRSRHLRAARRRTPPPTRVPPGRAARPGARRCVAAAVRAAPDPGSPDESSARALAPRAAPECCPRFCRQTIPGRGSGRGRRLHKWLNGPCCRGRASPVARACS
jgi:hypothetical protein